MPPHLIFVGGSALLLALGFGAEKTGEGIDSAGNGAIKFAIAAGVGFVIAKKLKVI